MNQKMSNSLKTGDNTPVVLQSNDETVQIFENDLFGSVRFVEKNEKQFAVASDVAKALGYVKPQNAVRLHCRRVEKGWVTKSGHDISKGKVEVLLIPEGDIYRLVARSELPQAEKFESWIFDEVLPTIRKHGVYITDEAYQEYLNDKDMFDKRISEAHEEIQSLRLENEELSQANELLTNQYNDVKLMWNNCTNDIMEFAQSQLSYKKTAKARCIDVYNAYYRWSENNQHSTPRTQKEFDEELPYWRVQGHPIVKEGNYYLGIEVRK